MPATYKFKGVPKTFETREQALTFLLNSPGYVKRRQKYLATYWPGLLADVKGRTAPKGRAGITRVAEQQTLRQRSARLRGVEQPSAIGHLLEGAATSAFDKAKAGTDFVSNEVGNLVRPVRGSGATVTSHGRDLTPKEAAGKVESVSDAVLGKSLTNLAMHGDVPNTWGEAAGLGVGVAGIFPIGRGVKGAAALRTAFKGEKAALEAEKVAAVLSPAAKAAATRKARSARAAIAAKAVPEADWPALGATKAKQNLGTPVVAKSLNQTVQGALKDAPEAIAAQNAAYSQERAVRINKGLKAYYDAGGGTAGADALFGELKGELPKISWGAFTEFTPETADKMIRHIVEEADLRQWEVPRAIAGMRRMIDGRPPQENQRLLLEKVFGKSNIDSITNPDNAGLLGFIHKHALEAWNTPRTLMASFDMSAPFRQGLVAGARHPVIFARNFKPMVKAWGSEEFAQGVMDQIASSPNLTRYYKSKLALTDASGPTALREEQFPPGLLDKAPGVKHSARAYSAFLDLERVHVFDRMIDIAEKDSYVSKLLGPTLSHYLGFSVKNVDDPEFLDALGRYINVSTGRGKLPWKTAEKAAPFLNSFLFSPRLMASRIAILNPFYYVNLYRQSPFVARQAAQAFVATLGGVSAMLYLASNIPGVKVGANPLSADFGKIRVGNTRIDIAGGLQQYLVLYTRLIRGKSVSSSTGKTQDLKGGYGDSSRLDVLTRFIEGKFAPSAGMIRDALNGQTFIGDPLTPQGMAYSNLTPLNVQGGIELYNTEGSIPAAVGGGLLSSIGFGVNSYPDKPPSTRKKKSGSHGVWGDTSSGNGSSSDSAGFGVWSP